MMQSPHFDLETATMLNDAAAHFLSSEHSRERLRAIYDNRSALSLNIWRQMAEQGWLSLRWPVFLGGAGLDLYAASVLAEQFGRHLVPEPFETSAAMPAALAEFLAGDAMSPNWKALVDQSISGSGLTAIAWQDTLDTLNARPTARVLNTSNGLALNARKYGVIAASVADAFVVTALSDDEPALWLIPRTTRGITLRDHLTSDGSTVSEIDFNGTPLTSEMLLARGPLLESALAYAIDEAMLLTVSRLIGIAEGAFALTLDYLRTREQFGKRIGSFQALQHAAVDVRLQIVLARASRQAALGQHAATPLTADTRAAIAAAKARASDAALLAGRYGVQMHGALGYAAEADIGLYLKSALRLAAYLGNGDQQRERYGKLAQLHEQH